MATFKSPYLIYSFLIRKDRLSHQNPWLLLLPILSCWISFLALVYMLGLNSSSPQQTSIPSLESDILTENTQGLWLSVTSSGDTTLIRDIKGTNFSITDDSKNSDYDLLISYLKDKATKLLVTSAIQNHIGHPQTEVVLSVSKEVEMLHINRIVAALSKASFTNYAFEFTTIHKSDT